MPRIYVEFAKLKQCGDNFKNISSQVDKIRSDFRSTVKHLDWDIKYKADINKTADKIAQQLEVYSKALKKYQQFIDSIHDRYVKLDQKQMDKMLSNMSIDKLSKNVTLEKAHSILKSLGIISPLTELIYILSGTLLENTDKFPSFSQPIDYVLYSQNASWLGYDFADDHPGVSCWIGGASSDLQTSIGGASIAAYVGKCSADFNASAGFMKYKDELKYYGKNDQPDTTINNQKNVNDNNKSTENIRNDDRNTTNNNNGWKEETKLEFLYAGIGVGGKISGLAVEGNEKIGNDMLGAEVNGNVDLLNLAATGDVGFSIGEDGLDLNAEGKVMVSAAEGKASTTFSLLGLDITGTIGGYAGAAGVEGEIGIKDNKFVAKGGLAAILGIYAGVEIGFNNEGWSNFVDFVTFWD